MKARIDAGTDVAMIGAWDARRGAMPLAEKMPPNLVALLENEVASADLYLIRTGADGGGPVDIYVDEAIPAETLARLEPVPGEHLLRIPSGELAVGGVEIYRAPLPKELAGKVAVPAGDYGVRCYTPRDNEAPPASAGELERLVGAAELKRYDRTNFLAVMGGFAIPAITFAGATWMYGWKIAAAAAILAVLAYPALMQWTLRRNAAYVRLEKVVTDFRFRNQDPSLVLALRTAPPGHGLAGGSISLA